MPTRAAYDRGQLDQVLADQFAMVSRGQAVAAGMKESRIDYLIREDGRWQRVLPGVYATTTGTLTPEQRDMAALLHAGPESILTGHAAVTRHNVRCSGSNNIDVLVPKKTRVASSGFVRVMHSDRMPEDWHSTDGLRFACLPRAIGDAARGMKRLSDVRAVVAEAVQRELCEIPELVEELVKGPRTGSARFRHALSEICAGIRSAAEADLADIVADSGLEEPLYNPRLYAADGTFIGIPDAWWPRAGVAAEVDSLQYHLSPADYDRTVARHNRLQGEGITLLHFLPRRLKQDRATVISDIRRALAAGNARPQLPITTIPATSSALAQAPAA